MKSPTRTKSAPAAANSRGFFQRRGIADAGRLEHSAHHCRRSAIASADGRWPLGIGLAEQHVIRAGFARDHRVVPRGQSADAGDAVGLQRWQRLLHGLDAGQMRAVGAGARDQIDMAVEQQRRAASWIAGASALIARVMVRWSVGFEPHQHRRDIGRGEQGGRLAISAAGSSTRGVAR